MNKCFDVLNINRKSENITLLFSLSQLHVTLDGLFRICYIKIVLFFLRLNNYANFRMMPDDRNTVLFAM